MIEQLYEKYISCEYSISTDTRNIKENSLFFALKGHNFDGNKFAKEAIEKGAKYAVIDNKSFFIDGKTILVENVLRSLQLLANHHRKQFDIPIIGITGSNGKTTSKELIGCVLETTFKTLYTKGNLNNHIGVPLTLLSLRKEHEIAIVEMGANGLGEIKELCSIAEPSHGIITNIGMAHIEGFGSFEGVKKTKKELYDFIALKKGTIFYNADDDVLNSILPSGIDSISFGKKNKNISGNIVESSPFIGFSWKSSVYQSSTIKTHLIGEYNFYNFLLAICIASHFKVDEEKINHSLSSYQPTNNRSQIQKTNTNTVIMDCYNANPSSMKDSISFFTETNPNRPRLFVLGGMEELGDEEKLLHGETGAGISLGDGDLALMIGEKASWIAAGMLQNGVSEDQILLLNEKEDARPVIEDFDGAVLFKGSRKSGLETLVPSWAI